MRRLPLVLLLLLPAVAWADPLCKSVFDDWACFVLVAVPGLVILVPSLAVAWFCFGFVFNGRPGWGFACCVGMAVATAVCPFLIYVVTRVGPDFVLVPLTSVLLGVVTFVAGWVVLRSRNPIVTG